MVAHSGPGAVPHLQAWLLWLEPWCPQLNLDLSTLEGLMMQHQGVPDRAATTSKSAAAVHPLRPQDSMEMLSSLCSPNKY